jgi:hypothetical protein
MMRMTNRERAAARILARKDVSPYRRQITRDALAADGVERARYVIKVAERYWRRFCR